MKAKQIKTLIDSFVKLNIQKNEWLETINSEVRDVFFDNSYINYQYQQMDLLMKFAFGDLYDDINWFINDWQEGYNAITKNNDYTINNLDDYIDYLKAEKLIK